MRLARLLIALACSGAGLAAAERINHAGRVLGAELAVAAPMSFDAHDDADPQNPAKNVDLVLATLQVMPRDSAWNEDVSALPLLGGSQAKSDAMIAMIRNDLSSSASSTLHRLVVFKEMDFVLVPPGQPLTGIRFVTYPGDSDYNGGTPPVAQWPVPSIMPVEGFPSETGSQSLDTWQRASGGDRHAIVVQPGATPRIFETWNTQLTNNTPNWQAANGAIFPLDSNTGRTPGDTSGDAAGLPMFPALVRYDECVRGEIEHAMRIVVKRSRQSYLYPASHQAGSTTDANVPAMGQRVRLKASYVIPASWSAQERALAVALKKYGALVADNGGFFSISICPDLRWPAGCWSHLDTHAGADFLDINQFEIVEGTAAGGGPRASGAPTCDAGPDQGVTLAAGAALAGSASGGSGLATLWELYDGPGTVTFGDATLPATTASFSTTGTWRLRLRAGDGTHTPAYDVVEITVAAGSNPVPVLTSIAPTTAVQNSGSFTLTLQGSNFVPASRVAWSGRADLTASSATATTLTVTVPASYLASTGAPQLSVFNRTPGGGTSTGRPFTITADVTAPAISALGASGVTATTATIGWLTNEAATGQVDYGPTAAYGSSTTVATALVGTHAVALSGLAASTLYHVRARSLDAAGNPAASGDATFTTAALPVAGGGGGSDGGGGGGGCGLGALSAALMLALGLGFRPGRRSSCAAG